MRRLALVLVLLALGVVPRVAQAYPQWQFSTGTTRCNQCHFNPAGGGLITEYGRDAAGDELSTFPGDGGFLHGKVELPRWLALGADLRAAYLQHDAGNPDGALKALFPMQADAYARVTFLDQFSLALTAGIRGQTRKASGDIGPDNFRPETASRFVSREHYLLWRAAALGPYLRAGRFYAPYGLRLAEHTTYVRRDLGYNLQQETYTFSAGMVQNGWELHVSGFVPDDLLRSGGEEKGAALMGEYRIAGIAGVGISGRMGITDDGRRYQGGTFGKLYIEPLKTMLMVEGDIVNVGSKSGPSSNQAVGYAGLTVFPLRGVWLSVYGERLQTDISVRDTATNAVNGQLNWFPFPHFEFVLLGRMQKPTGQEAAKTLLLQLHYYL